MNDFILSEFMKYITTNGSLRSDKSSDLVRSDKSSDLLFDHPDKYLTSHRPGLKYRFLPLKLNNMVLSRFANMFPDTMLMFSHAVSIFFKILSPGCDTKVARDTSSGILRLEYPVIISSPNRNCGVWIDDIGTLHFHDSTLVYDASKKHVSFNYSRGESVVLVVDVQRDDYVRLKMTREMTIFIESLFVTDDE